MDKCIPRQHDEAKNIETKIKDIFMLRTCQTNCKVPFTLGYLVLEEGQSQTCLNFDTDLSCAFYLFI